MCGISKGTFEIPHKIYYPYNGPLTRYVKLQVAHAPGMPGTFSPAADFKGNRKLAIPACITARAWRTCRDACRDRLPAVTGKAFPAFPAHAHPQYCLSGKRPMKQTIVIEFWKFRTFKIYELVTTRHDGLSVTDNQPAQCWLGIYVFVIISFDY